MGVKGLTTHVLILQMHSHGQCGTCDLIHVSTHLVPVVQKMVSYNPGLKF